MESRTRLKVLVVPVDFSPRSGQALEFASGLAAAVGARLHVLHVVEALRIPLQGFVRGFGNEGLVARAEEARRQLSLLASRVEQVEYVMAVRVGIPAEVIAEYASGVEADLIIMGTRGRRGLSRVILGSMTEAVLHRAPCSVLMMRETEVGAPEPEEAVAAASAT